LEDERHVLTERPRPFLGILEAVESCEQGAVRAADALDLDRQGIPVEEGRRDHPRGLVASIHRKGIGVHPLMIPPGTEDPVCSVPGNPTITVFARDPTKCVSGDAAGFAGIRFLR
jgi:hypothetical protein